MVVNKCVKVGFLGWLFFGGIIIIEIFVSLFGEFICLWEFGLFMFNF